MKRNPYHMGVSERNGMLMLDSFDESIVGADTSDPLRFAFKNKHSAHAGGSASPVAAH